MICNCLFKQGKHIGTKNQMAQLLDETFKMVVMAQYNIVLHVGVEAIEVRVSS